MRVCPPLFLLFTQMLEYFICFSVLDFILVIILQQYRKSSFTFFYSHREFPDMDVPNLVPYFAHPCCFQPFIINNVQVITLHIHHIPLIQVYMKNKFPELLG